MRPILQYLSLDCYRGIAGLELSDLSPVSLIVGANNAGKSSILEAAGLILRPPDPGQWVTAVRRRDADLSLIDGIWAMFPGAETIHPEDGPQQSSDIRLRAVLCDSERMLSARAEVSVIPSTQEGEKDLALRVDLSVDGKTAIQLNFPGIKPVKHQVPVYRVFTVTPASHYSTRVFVEQLSQVVDAGRKQLAVEVMNIFDNDVEDLDVIKSHGREAVRVTHASRGVVDLSSFGDGMRRAAVLALTLARASQHVLLIDEIEAGIHYGALRSVLGKVLEAAASARVQLLATTHSLEAVDALVAAVAERDDPGSLSAYWVRRKDGKHESRRYDFERLRRMREGGHDIR